MERCLSYRRDIDGLRALAVLSVVAFHAFPAAVPGGFIGVDVFFVISGYLITSIILKGLASGSFSFVDFYSRRILRIFPALTLVAGTTLFLGWHTLLPGEFRDYAKSLAAGLTFVANFNFWSESGYFDTSAELKPLLHLWSLGDEEQFYLLWPFCLFLCFRLRASPGRWIATGLLLSFVINIAFVASSPAASYFLLPARAWQLLIGGLLAYSVGRNGFTATPRIAGWAAWTGAGLFLAGVFLISRDTSFPGWWAILPTLGGSLIIAAGPKTFLNGNVLGARALVGIGLISYPLYLWHWPLLSFLRIVRGTEPGVGALALTVGFAVALSMLTYRVIELPVRRGGQRSTLVLLSISVVLLFLAGEVFFRDGVPSRLKDPKVLSDAIALQWPDELRFGSDCQSKFPGGVIGECLVQDGHRRADALILGDSHANHLYWGLAKELSRHGRNLMQIVGGGCPPLYGVKTLERGVLVEHCTHITDRSIDFAVAHREIRTVFLSARWPSYILGREARDPADHVSKYELTLSGQPDNSLPRGEVFARALDETLSRLLSAGKTVVFVHDVPEAPFHPRECLSWSPNRFVNRVQRETCDYPATYHESRELEFRSFLSGVLNRYPQVAQIDPGPLFCTRDKCLVSVAGELLYRDYDHLSIHGAKWLAGQLLSQSDRTLVFDSVSPESDVTGRSVATSSRH